jgi:taurine dioxygenase
MREEPFGPSFQDAPFEVIPLGEFGAEVAGIDLKEPVDDETARHLRMVLAKFQILVFRNQTFSPAEQTRFTRCFGNLEPGIARRPEGHQVPGHPHILYLSNKSGSPTLGYGSAWHSDGLAYARVPHGVTMLHCIACPPGVGDTLFANQYEAYGAMYESLRKILKGLYWYLPRIPYSEIPTGKGLAQPMVRTHSETGREFLFCSPSACQIRGMTRYESAAILKLVHGYQVRDEFVYRHAWRELDVVLWENCTLLHNRADVIDFAIQGLRAMHRSATSGSFEAIECEAAED